MTSDDRTVLSHVSELSAEEHDLWQREAKGSATDDDRSRLRAIEVELDQCWDLLRQRQARRNAGLDPDDAHARSVDTVEGYQQ
jgi:hypothetical protein